MIDVVHACRPMAVSEAVVSCRVAEIASQSVSALARCVICAANTLSARCTLQIDAGHQQKTSLFSKGHDKSDPNDSYAVCSRDVEHVLSVLLARGRLPVQAGYTA